MRSADEPITDPFEPAPPGSYLDGLERESRQQAARRGDDPVWRVGQRQEALARRAGEAPPPWPVIPEAAE